MALSDSSGVVQTEYTYEPFGLVTTTGSSTGNTLAFTGREADGTGLYFYRARYYDPRLQRFTAEDPLRELGGINSYSYVSNQPTFYIDPYGLVQVCCRPVDLPGSLPNVVGKHCYVKLSDGTVYGGYNVDKKIKPDVDCDDDKYPKTPPTCVEVGGSDGDIRKAWEKLRRDRRYYGFDGTSNTIAGELLDIAGIKFDFPWDALGHSVRRPERFPPR
jgi:RHS repeat-associated protein